MVSSLAAIPCASSAAFDASGPCGAAGGVFFHSFTPRTSSETSRASMARTFRRAHSSVVMCGLRFAHCGSKRNLTNASHAKKDSTHPG